MSSTLGDVCVLKGGSGFPEVLQGDAEGEIPFIKVSDMSLPGNGRVITHANNYVSAAIAKQLNASIFPAQTVVFAKVGAALLLNRRRVLTRPTIIDNNMMAAIPNGVDPDFLYHYLCSLDLASYVQSGALPSVNQSTLSAIDFPTFARHAQRRIADILSSVDEAIEKTGALIAKQQQIKAGLMHDLFSRGVTPDGRLRPTRDEAPHLYKDTPLGWLPKEWEVAPLRESAQWLSGGTPARAIDAFWQGSVPWLTPKDMKSFELADTSEHLTLAAAQSGSRLVGPDSVFIVVRGMILAHSFPVVISTQSFAFNQDIKALVPAKHVTPRFLAHWLVSRADTFLRMTTQATHGTKRLEMNDVLRLLIGLPKATEQAAILRIIDNLSANIESLSVQSKKLSDQKQGLMADLLSGRVRVDALVEPVGA